MIDILDLNEVERIITDITSAQNLMRKRNEYISYEVGSGLLRKYVAAKIKDMYPVNYAAYTISEYSLVKKVVDKKARAYKEPPIRKLENESDTKAYTEVLKLNRFNDAMKDMDRIYNQHKYAGLYFEVDEEEQTVSYYPLRPYEFDIVKNDEGEVECLILSYPGAQVTQGTQDKIIAGDRANDDLNEIEYVFWTETNHLVVQCSSDSEGHKRVKVQEIEGNPNNENPYGKIPFAYLPFDFNEDYPSPSPLTSQCITLNALLSVYLTSSNMQVGTLVFKHPATQSLGKLAAGIHTALDLPQSGNVEDKPTTAEYISPNPDLAGHKEAITTYLTMILDEQGINSAQVLSGAEKFSSGLDRLLSQSDVQSIIEDNQDFYVRFEQECFDIINAMSGMPFKEQSLGIVFKKPKMLTSDKDNLDNIVLMLDNGMIEEWEKFVILDPNLSEDQAKEKLKRINESKSSALSDMVNINMGASNAPATGTLPGVKVPTNNLNGRA